MKRKLIRIATIGATLDILLKGQLSYLNRNYEVIAVSDDDKELKNVGEREGIRIKGIPMKRDISLLNDLTSLYFLYKFFKKEKPSIIHSNTPKGSLLSMIAGKAAGIKHRVYTVTGLRFEGETGMKRKLLKNMERLSCYFATKVIPEGNGVKETLRKEKITSKPLEIIHNGNINGIDLNWYKPSDKEKNKSIGQNNITFCFIGRIVRDKGIIELTEAFSRLYDKYRNIELLLVGPFEKDLDPIPERTEKAIISHPAINHVGFQSDVRPWLEKSDILAFPSYREGFPNVVLQAGAMGLPCIVSDINGCNEIIKNRYNGLIIPSRDTDALYESMESIIKDRNLTETLTANARNAISTRFDQKDVWRELEKMYDGLLS